MKTIEKFNLKNEIIIITGGAGFLGKRYTKALLEANAIVIIFDINKDALKKLKAIYKKEYKNKIFTYKVDISDEKSILDAKNKIFKKLSIFDFSTIFKIP